MKTPLNHNTTLDMQNSRSSGERLLEIGRVPVVAEFRATVAILMAVVTLIAVPVVSSILTDTHPITGRSVENTSSSDRLSAKKTFLTEFFETVTCGSFRSLY